MLLWQTIDRLLDGDPDTGTTAVPPANVTYFAFDDVRITDAVSPHDIVGRVPPGVDPAFPRYFFFDEVTRFTRWDAWLKQAVDDARRTSGGAMRYVVSDSAASLLVAGNRQSGQGRWDRLTVEGLPFREFLRLQALPDESPEQVLARLPNTFETYLAIGGFPEHVATSPNELAQAQRRIREDIVDRAIYRDLERHGVDTDRVRRLFVYLAGTSGQDVNLADRAQDLSADGKSLRRWIELLQEAHLLHALDPFESSDKASARLRVRKLRLFVADHGMVAALATSPPTEEPVRGRVFETAVYRHLRALVRDARDRVTYLRVNEDLEADFVLEHAGRRVVIEVTSAAEVTAEKRKRTREAATRAGAGRAFVIHRGLEEHAAAGLVLLPMHRFLLEPERIVVEEEPT